MSLIAFLRRNPLPAFLLAMALTALIWFSTGFVREALYFSDPAHQQQNLATWMSPRYVAKSWDLPREVMIETMDLQPDNAQQTLQDVLDHLGITIEELQIRVEAAKAKDDARRREHHGPDGHGDQAGDGKAGGAQND